MRAPRPKRGDLVRVDWIDICSDVTGDPKDAELARRKTHGLFWRAGIDKGGTRVVVLAIHEDDDNTAEAGWWIYPASCVTRITVIRRGAAKL